MLEQEQQARRDLEVRLLPAPAKSIAPIIRPILLAVLLGATVAAATVYWWSR